MLDGPQAAAHLRRRRALHRGWGLGGPWQQPAEPSARAARAVLRKSKLVAAVVSSMLVQLKRVSQQRTSAAFAFFSGGASASWPAFCFGIDFRAIGFAQCFDPACAPITLQRLAPDAQIHNRAHAC